MYDATDELVEEAGDEYGEQELKTAEALDVPVVIAKVRHDCLTCTRTLFSTTFATMKMSLVVR